MCNWRNDFYFDEKRKLNVHFVPEYHISSNIVKSIKIARNHRFTSNLVPYHINGNFMYFLKRINFRSLGGRNSTYNASSDASFLECLQALTGLKDLMYRVVVNICIKYYHILLKPFKSKHPLMANSIYKVWPQVSFVILIPLILDHFWQEKVPHCINITFFQHKIHLKWHE